VLDELRRQDWAPRSVRRWERDIEKASVEFTALHGRHPSSEELAQSIGCSVKELRQRVEEISRSDLTSLNTVVLSDDETTIERMDTLASTDERLDPEHAAQTEDAKDRFREAFSKLPRREREIAVLLYVKGMTLAEIGEIMGVSESRVCQIHTQMKKTLRSELGDHEAILRLVA
jgi:RNA polymerase sigma factor for flagellar operon FliA